MSATPPEPLALESVKLNLRVDGFEEDGLITDLITDAREFVERETGLVLVPRTITETAAELGAFVELASWPITSVSAVRYPIAGVLTPLANGAWLVSTKRRPVRLLPATIGWGVTPRSALPCWHSPALPIEIDVEAGYATPADVPRPATRAMHMLINHWYANRSAVESGARAAAIELPLGVEVLLNQLRLTRV